jgi:hypothetical protein
MREGVVDHEVVDVIVRDAGLGKGLGPATRNAREEVKSSIWLTIGVSTLSPVPSSRPASAGNRGRARPQPDLVDHRASAPSSGARGQSGCP